MEKANGFQESAISIIDFGRRILYLPETDNPFQREKNLFVLPQWRGHGLGRRLLTYVAGVTVTRGCGRLEWSALDWNEPAIAFYKELGAQAMDEWTVYRLTDDALRQLALETGKPRRGK